MTASPIAFASRLEPEDRVRADFYAIFARLFFSPADAQLLQLIGNAPLLDAEADAAALAIAWARLAAAARVMEADAATDEYEALFGGVGHSAVSLFGSFYVGTTVPPGPGNASDLDHGAPFLVQLRGALARLGVGLQQGQNLPEDHLAPMLETMRLMIEGRPGVAPRDIAGQHEFFRAFIAPWCTKCCTAIEKNPIANFYRVVAQSLSAFIAIEDESLAIA